MINSKIPRQHCPADSEHRRYLWAAVAVMVVAAFMRLTQMDAAPPGPFYDDAANGLIARSIAYGGELPIFTLAFTGREPLYHYIVAILMLLLGNDLLALRIASFFLGMFVVAGTLSFGRAFFRGKNHVRWLALLTGILTATTFWPVSNARFGMRAISFTFTISMLLWSLSRLWQRGRIVDAVWAGVWTAATAYTYTANRMVPIALGLVMLWLLLGRERQLTWRHVAGFALTAIVLFAPMGIFLLQHPEVITHRAAQVSAFQNYFSPGEWILAVLRGVIVALGAFGFRGDPLLGLNIPGRPVFNAAFATLFYVGLVVVVIRTVSGKKCSRMSGMVLIWFGVMLLPGALTIEPFHSLRSLGVLPIAMLLPTVGFATVLAAIERRRAIPSWILGCLCAIILVGTAIETYHAYFNRWARDPILYSLRNGDMADLARWFNEHDTDEAVIYIATHEYQHPTVALIADDYERIKWAALGRTIVYPPPDQEAYIGIPQSVITRSPWMVNILASAEIVASPQQPDGRFSYLVYYIDPDTPRPHPQHSQEINFANSIRLIGYDEISTESGLVTILLYWEIMGDPPLLDYGLVARLVDNWGFRWIERGIFNYPPEQWAPGEIIIHQLVLERPPGMPPGEYNIEFEWFSPSTEERLPIVRDGQFGGVYGYIESLLIPADATVHDDQLPMQHEITEIIGPLRLLGYDRETSTLYAGDILRLALYWRAETPSSNGLTMTLVLQGEEDEAVQLYEGSPVHGTYPTSDWVPGELIVDRYAIRLTPDVPMGTYTLWLRVEEVESTIALGELMVLQSDRIFEAQPVAHEQTAEFGDTVRLVGYNLAGPFQAGETIVLQLVWQAITPPEDSYSVFVHVVDEEQRIVTQHDSVPRGNYPLYRWIEGEIVTDEISLTLPATLPAGEYEVRIGFYRPGTGERLPILASSGPAGADFIWLETAVEVR